MKKAVATALAGITALGAFALYTTDADARRYQGRARVGVYIGAPVVVSPFFYGPRPFYYGYGPAYGYPYGYSPAYYPPVVVREEPLVYIEQQAPVATAPAPGTAPQAQQQQQHWFFCQDTQTYFPHVQNCATPWQRVMPHAPQ